MLRTKVARASTKATAEDLPEDPQAFLHAYKETKKEKLQNKRSQLLNKLNAHDGISKSSQRRIKRKQRDELKPKMQDLLETLESEVGKDTINLVDSKEFIASKTKRVNAPSTKTRKGIKKVEDMERQRFGAVLKDATFKKSPFQALKESIANRIAAENTSK
ncbi:Ribosome biogenesis protein SLX9 [Cyberlindnera fabianii]|uniref:Ribosome biogenesis protein SLX9 n=1 Tax=Cyberlindnera fabianii TaxID=36022 RepID=A0A1V2L0J9_CYBFA|nr:Ribosome biogenesis protein SLX9 [Cyberlindnera fabianii]